METDERGGGVEGRESEDTTIKVWEIKEIKETTRWEIREIRWDRGLRTDKYKKTLPVLPLLTSTPLISLISHSLYLFDLPPL